jgi:hypothetical protein
MSKFLTELNICPHPDDDSRFYLTEPLVYQSDLIAKLFAHMSNMLGKGIVTAPKGFLTDLASTAHIPIVNLIWGGRAHREAVLHDYLYCLDAEPDVEQELADDIFFEAMECRGKPSWVRYPMFWGVRLGGWMFFKKKRVSNTIVGKVTIHTPNIFNRH